MSKIYVIKMVRPSSKRSFARTGGRPFQGWGDDGRPVFRYPGETESGSSGYGFANFNEAYLTRDQIVRHLSAAKKMKWHQQISERVLITSL